MHQNESSSTQGNEFNELRNELQETVAIVNKNNFLHLKAVQDNLIAIDNEFQIKSQIIFRAYDLLKSQQKPDNKFKFVPDGLKPEDAQMFKYDSIIAKILSEDGAKCLLEYCKEESFSIYIFNTFLPAIFGGYTTKSRCQARRKLFEIIKSQEGVSEELIFHFICSFFLWDAGYIKNFHQFVTKSEFDWNNQTKCAKSLLLAFERTLSFCSQDLHDILAIYIDDESKYLELLKKILFFTVDYLCPQHEVYSKLKAKIEGLPNIMNIIDNFQSILPRKGTLDIISQDIKFTLDGLSTTTFDSGVTGDIILSRYDFAIISKLNGKELFKECFEPKNIFESKYSLIHVPTMKEFAPQIGIENYPENWKRIYMESKQNKTDFLQSIDGLYYIEGKHPVDVTKVSDNFYIKTAIKNDKEELSRIISLIKNYKDFELKRSVNACGQLTSIQCDQEFILTYYKNVMMNLSLTASLLFRNFTDFKQHQEPAAISFDYTIKGQLANIQSYANAYYLYEKGKIAKPK
ncbi:hypothetical protein TVAG_209120 [Trichomonas vaginalis G3]|uniref:Uncharacterized protein n=1 Tax=Trichomonas vaginalis (strain ATCC PRA-98 / G3) TaxID=412133 RepID=A2DVF4_TRIV3|nr:hypothetical protein TVAGG3_0335470 [Trichomonas vaginalis G3]EAY15633.1 hypothetical protein TVAG_209120 [Trichomonas vaginalis G3]KAI5530239.1 hypothetical protein TVAGG3_0335470 [Trichomonas vaginalis G3]|eukprot:XP_001327856.1 hypothetical protein [Trichomonas vaginalis G3]